MHGGSAAAPRPERSAVLAAALAALLAPVLFVIAMFPARLLAWPFLALLEGWGQAGLLLAGSAWFCVCSLILLALLSIAAQKLGLSPRARRLLVTATWLWAVVPCLALAVVFATAPD